MELRTRDNVIIAVSIGVALVVFFGLGEYTELDDAVRYLVLTGIGVIVPMALTNS